MEIKKIAVFFLFLVVISCVKNDDSDPPITGEPQNISVLIAPNLTDANYSSAEEEHYVIRNDKTHLNTMLLFLGGTRSAPDDYRFVCDHAASIGLDVISLSYPNSVAAAPLGSSSDPLIFDNYRDEICFGDQSSDEVDVNALNSINSRVENLLKYLNLEYPDQNWGQYLTASNTPRWDKIIISGHSQGAGHASYLGKIYSVNRVVMFSGPNDYSTFFDAPANWLSESGETPLSKHFSLLHERDQVVDFAFQVTNLRALGLLSANEEPVLADDLTTPYSNANSLSINTPALSFHNGPIGSNRILPEIWTYLFIGN